MLPNDGSDIPVAGPGAASETAVRIDAGQSLWPRLRWVLLAGALSGAVAVYTHCGHGTEAARSLSEAARESIRSIDADAVRIWDAQSAAGSDRVPAASASPDEQDAFRRVVRERSRLFVEYQRLMTRAGAAAFREGGVPSSLRLVRSDIHAFFAPRSIEDAGAKRFVADESFLQEQRVTLDPGADPSRLFVGQVIDRRFDGPEVAEEVLLHASPTDRRDRGIALRRREAKPLTDGTALAMAQLPLAGDLVKASNGTLTLAAGGNTENARCMGLYATSTVEFADDPGEVYFDIRVAAGEAADRNPRVVYQVLSPDQDPTATSAAPGITVDCGSPHELEWARVDEATATLVSQDARRGWQCRFQVDRASRPATSFVLVRVELPYPGCPHIEDSLSPKL